MAGLRTLVAYPGAALHRFVVAHDAFAVAGALRTNVRTNRACPFMPRRSTGQEARARRADVSAVRQQADVIRCRVGIT